MNSSRRLGQVAALGLVASLAGCGGHRSGSAESLTAHNDGTGSTTVTVTGVLRGYGGPLVIMHGHRHMAMNGGGLPDHEIVARHQDVGLTTRTDKHGRFALRLAPGTYQLSADCSLPKRITVSRATEAPIALQCDFP